MNTWRRLRRGLLSRLLCAVVRRNLEARDQYDVHNLIIVGFIVPVNDHFTPARSQGDEILMFHQQTATVSHVNEKGAEGLCVKQLPDFIRFHVFNIIGIPDSRKRRGPFDFLSCCRHSRTSFDGCPACAASQAGLLSALNQA